MSDIPEDEEVARLFGRGTIHSVVDPFLRRYGRRYLPQDLPTKYAGGKFGVCYANSYRLASEHAVTYVEGYAISTRTASPHLHAWCVDEKGLVLDPTWRSGTFYFGIPFRLEFLKKAIAERTERGDCYYGWLDDWRPGWPLINELGEQPELWLEPSYFSRKFET
ncbi:hypothetical protein [Anatilimnocola floriformis]|uniref:hypothetical protein n=1 Tax=Anatilimnocola floriformis TaxID=2948575 RepID=UPI0020C33A56|nr:hypothetical protein [Anatilimnocola floriformis]